MNKGKTYNLRMPSPEIKEEFTLKVRELADKESLTNGNYLLKLIRKGYDKLIKEKDKHESTSKTNRD